MLNPLPVIWRAESVELPAVPLTKRGMTLLEADTRRNGFYLGAYPACFGVVREDYMCLRIARVPQGTFPPRLEAHRTPNGAWSVVFQRSLGDRLWLTLWLGGVALVTVFMAWGAFHEYPTPGWTTFALGSVAMAVLYVILLAILRWELKSWSWQKAQLEAFVAKGFVQDAAV